MQGWKAAGELTRHRRWTLKELADSKRTLFAKHDPGLPPFNF
jgi:hypothetical protein